MNGNDKFDWSEVDALTDEQITAAALADPDAQPLTDADFARMRETPRSAIIRRALRLTREEFSQRYRIPLATLVDWEERRSEPSQTERAFLHLIACDPEGVYRALNPPERNAAE
jgi:putative transcriptional regulator